MERQKCKARRLSPYANLIPIESTEDSTDSSRKRWFLLAMTLGFGVTAAQSSCFDVKYPRLFGSQDLGDSSSKEHMVYVDKLNALLLAGQLVGKEH